MSANHGSRDARRVVASFALAAALLTGQASGIIAGDVRTETAIFRAKKTLFLDKSSPAWESINRRTVADYNKVRPRGMTRLVYVNKETEPCESVAAEAGAIVACSKTTGLAYGVTSLNHDADHIISRAVIELNDRYVKDEREALNTVCHELMHATTWIGDRYGKRTDERSCVWGGTLTTFGSTDVRIMKQAVKRHGKKR